RPASVGGAPVVAAGARLVGGGGGPRPRPRGAARLALVARAPQAPGRRALRRRGRRRRDAGGGGRGHVGPAAPGCPCPPPGRRPAGGHRMAGAPRRGPRSAPLCRRGGRAAGRRGLPPRRRGGGRGGPARGRARAFPGMDGGPAMSALAVAWPGFAGFAWPWLLLALPLPWLVRLLPPLRQAGPALRVPWGERLAEVARPAGRRAGGRGRPWLAWAGWVVLCMAAARPMAWGEAVQPPHSARELMLAVDLSASMGERDMVIGDQVVDRLSAAKAVIADFLERRTGDRVGLLVFGRDAHVLAPATADLATVREQLLATEVALAGRETAIGDAIGLGIKRLRAQDDGDRVLVLLTDGVNTAGALDPMRAAEIARDEGIRI